MAPNRDEPQNIAAEPMVETARIRALVALCYPDHMTPVAKRQFENVCEEVERAAQR